MNASELSRKLLFYGYDEATAFLKNSPLNRHLYKMFLDLLPKHQIEVPIVKLFNEIYYQCVRINYDGTPGIEIGQRYLSECEAWLESQPATQIVFSIVWALLCNKKNYTFYEECYMRQLEPYIQNCNFRGLANILPKELHELGINIPDTFPTMTCSVDVIPMVKEPEDKRRSLTEMINASVERDLGLRQNFFEIQEHGSIWSVVTCNYSHSVIENLVRLYSNPEDQLKLIERMHKSLAGEAFMSQDLYFRDLAKRIKTGNFEPEDTLINLSAKNADGDTDEDGEFHYTKAFYRTVAGMKMEEVDDLKKERTRLMAELIDLQKSHEMEMARMEAQYKAEIEKVRNERNLLAHAPVVEPEPETKPMELTLTLTEIADHVKARFSKSGADEICTLLYGKAAEHGYLGEETFKLIDGIVPAILKRDKPQQTIEIPKVQQLNINPQEVVNHFKDEK